MGPRRPPLDLGRPREPRRCLRAAGAIDSSMRSEAWTLANCGAAGSATSNLRSIPRWPSAASCSPWYHCRVAGGHVLLNPQNRLQCVSLAKLSQPVPAPAPPTYGMIASSEMAKPVKKLNQRLCLFGSPAAISRGACSLIAPPVWRELRPAFRWLWLS